MQGPRDHHFIPAFYLKRWVDSSGKLLEYSRPHKTTILKKVGPRATGFQTDLYSFPELPEESRQILESEFFNHTDQLASDAMDKLCSGSIGAWTPALRSGWSRFVLNFRIRHPDPLEELRNHIKENWNRSDAYYEARYADLRKPEDPATLVDYTASLGIEAGQKIQMRFLHAVLDHQRLGQKINDMEWDVLDFSDANHALLTSDWPAELVLAKGIISLPIGRSLLFVAGKDRQTLRSVRGAKRNKLVSAVNKYVVTKARRYVYSHNADQSAFIEKYFSKDMLKPPFWPSIGTSRGDAQV